MEGKDANQAGFPPGRRHLMEKRSTFKKKKSLVSLYLSVDQKEERPVSKMETPSLGS
jgi:hypothetical protein